MKLLFIIFSGAFFFFVNQALANFSISPTYVEFDANSNDRNVQVRITNTTNKEKQYTVSFVNYRQNENGTYEEIKTPLPDNPFASDFIDYSPHMARLAPRQTQTIRLKRKPMPTMKNGEYVSHLMVKEVPEKEEEPDKNAQKSGIKVAIKVIHAITIPVIITKGELTSTAELTNSQVIKKDGKYFAKVIVTRKGNKSFLGNIIVLEDGKEIGRINNFRIFISSPKRVLEVPLNKKPDKSITIMLNDARKDETISSKNI